MSTVSATAESTKALGLPQPLSNPFATRWVRPGAIPYQFPPQINAATIIAQLRKNHWRGAILGPHGSGKSTLLAMLIPELQSHRLAILSIQLHDGQRNLPADFPYPTPQDPPGIAIIDGYEQLGWRARQKLSRACRRSHWGLLITAHNRRSACSIPVLLETQPQLSTVVHLVANNLPPHHGLIEPADISSAFVAAQGNIRETLFALYDLFESRRRTK